MIDIRRCRVLADAAPLRGAINALNLASTRPDPFSTFEYYENHLRHAGDFAAGGTARLWLLLAYEDGALAGYAALKQCPHRVLGRRAMKIDWLTAHVADRPHLVARPGREAAVAAAVYAYLVDRGRHWSLLEFQQQEAGSPLQPPPADAIAGACRFRRWPSPASGTIPIRWESTAAYYAALTAKSRSNVSRQVRTLLAAGTVELLTSSDPRALAALLELYRGVEARSWKARAGGNGHAGTGRDAGLLDPAQPMRPVIQVLLLDGAPVAGLICGAFNRGLYALHIAYDERHARLAPGSAMLLMVVRLAIAGRYEFLDLLRGSGYYKTRWLAQMSETQSLQVYRAGSPFHWRRVLGDLVRFGSGMARAPGLLFNPARRDADAARTDTPAPPTAGERLRYAGLIAQARRAPGEFLSAEQLAAAMPFETRRPPARAPRYVRQRTDGPTGPP